MIKSNNKIVIGILLTIAILFVTGVSYAIWSMTLTQKVSNVITTGCFKVEFTDLNPIHLESAYPIVDEEGMKLTPYTFKITNTCDSYASYQINLEILNTTTLENLNYIKVMIDEEMNLLTSNEEVEKTLEDASVSYKLETGYLDANETKTFTLRLWMNESTPTKDDFMNKTLLSKVTIISSLTQNFDREDPIAMFQVTRNENEVVVDASNSFDNMSIKYYYYGLDGVNYIRTSSSSYTFDEQTINYGLATTSLIELEQNTINEVYVYVEDEYGNKSEVVSEIIGDMLYDKTEDNNLRYVGSSPDNYVMFNNELWRIIGVMNNIEDGKSNKETRIKLIRDENIGSFPWDSSNSSVNRAWGINEWSQSKLKNLLNVNYYNSTSTILNCAIIGLDDVISRTCSFNGNGLREEAKKYIEEVIWHTGANDKQIAEDGTLPEITTQQFYELERSNNTGKWPTITSPWATDTVTRTTSWLGKIGLISPSDYGYATLGSDTMNRHLCLEKSIAGGQTIVIKNCMAKNWLNKSSSGRQWTLHPAFRMPSNVNAFVIGDSVGVMMLGFQANVYPTIFLKSNVSIISGTGEKQNPYVLGLE